MHENRRDFLKKALGTTAVVATAGASGVLASSK
ncbi:twin-arginine translocation signal domain-containing protein [Sulfurospirillum cavolei]